MHVVSCSKVGLFNSSGMFHQRNYNNITDEPRLVMSPASAESIAIESKAESTDAKSRSKIQTSECNTKFNKKHLKNVGPIRYCEPPLHCQSPGVASRMPAIAIVQAACDVHNDDNAWQRGPLWPHGMVPTKLSTSRHCSLISGNFGNLKWNSM